MLEPLKTQCCIVGGGPAGMMLGTLLARAGVRTLVLEKHADFLRDFRGDTIHPSTLEVMHELGILEEFLKQPHQKVGRLGGQIGGTEVGIADFTHLPVRCPYMVFMPQWDFLNFLAEQGKRYPAFELKMQAEFTDFLQENGVIQGVRVKTPQGSLDVRADLVIGADGRHSRVRERAGLHVKDFGAPMDMLWFRLSRLPGDPDQSLGRFNRGKIMAMLNRGDYWQCGYAILKGTLEPIKQKGLAAFQADVREVASFLGNRVEELKTWEPIKLLTVRVDRLDRWFKPGLLCIGDSAHAMSPLGGVGINLAIQDAVAAANILSKPLKAGTVSSAELESVQRRRMFPTRMTQGMQLLLQRNVIGRVLGRPENPPLAWPLRLLRRWPLLRRLPARLIGIGFRPEHIHPL